MKLVARWAQVAAIEARICQVRAPFWVLLISCHDKIAPGLPQTCLLAPISVKESLHSIHELLRAALNQYVVC